jgi:hypothetical protein
MMTDDPAQRKYQKTDDCPEGRKEPPCPLYGGPMPDLEWGPPVTTFSGGETLPMEPGPGVSPYKFGTCDVCGAQLQTDAEGTPLGASK